MGANSGSRRYRGNKTNSIQPVIDPHLKITLNLYGLMRQVAQQRQSEEAMGDSRPKLRFGPRALGIHMNPLIVVRQVGEAVDHVLCNLDPLANPNLPASQVFKLIDGENTRRHVRSRYHKRFVHASF